MVRPVTGSATSAAARAMVGLVEEITTDPSSATAAITPIGCEAIGSVARRKDPS